ncbi:flagellar export protein FliJ [Geomonas sp. Red69]|uniref:flagellar export protein FliJ n=1 Tax=Geomonas diazotrophica TaxID=2843197 RepID=UPI001C11248B|nr:flagellar export protein FliJ [Geomonas diazotrophica]MBU5638605.1 flagellar export protein FliJ [Geomonas diazotrophica]
MAGQEFRLEQVLKFRKEVEKMHQLELAAAKQQHESARERLKNEKAMMEQLEQECAQRQMTGIQAKDLQLYGDFSRRKAQEIQQLRDSLVMLEKAVQEKREALLAAAKEKKALEVFKEKKMRDLRMEQLNRERAFLDEIAVQGRGHK